MPILFLPAAVGLLEAWDVLKPNLLPIAAITAVSTFVVMGAAGLGILAGVLASPVSYTHLTLPTSASV